MESGAGDEAALGRVVVYQEDWRADAVIRGLPVAWPRLASNFGRCWIIFQDCGGPQLPISLQTPPNLPRQAVWSCRRNRVIGVGDRIGIPGGHGDARPLILPLKFKRAEIVFIVLVGDQQSIFIK